MSLKSILVTTKSGRLSVIVTIIFSSSTNKLEGASYGGVFFSENICRYSDPETNNNLQVTCFQVSRSVFPEFGPKFWYFFGVFYKLSTVRLVKLLGQLKMWLT